MKTEARLLHAAGYALLDAKGARAFKALLAEIDDGY
jgi:hypothetical protein